MLNLSKTLWGMDLRNLKTSCDGPSMSGLTVDGLRGTEVSALAFGG